jgi:hypothetical protein
MTLARTCIFNLVVTAAIFFAFSFHAQATDRENLIYNFNRGSGGYGPGGTLVMDSSGNFYGAASEGNLSGFCCGTIFELSPKPGGGLAYSVLYTLLRYRERFGAEWIAGTRCSGQLLWNYHQFWGRRSLRTFSGRIGRHDRDSAVYARFK